MKRPALISFRALLAAAFFFAALAAPAFAQQSDMDPLAKKFAGKLKTGPTRAIGSGFFCLGSVPAILSFELPTLHLSSFR